MKQKPFASRLTCLVIALMLVGTAFSTITPSSIHERAFIRPWVDSLQVSVVDGDDAVKAIKKNEIDLYASSLWEDYEIDKLDPDVDLFEASSLEYELTLNPSGPVFSGTGKLNPFAVPAIREAMNMLIDRDYIVQNIIGSIAQTRLLPIHNDYPDYLRYNPKVVELETAYSYNYSAAISTITSEMLSLGATMSGDMWSYDGQKVDLIFLIRNDGDGLRIPIGDYIADQLDSAGFSVDRQYVTSAQALPIWLLSDPAEGQWHMYTAAWGRGSIDRDEGHIFHDFYSPFGAYAGFPLWNAYTPTPEFALVMDSLLNNAFTNMSERDIAFTRAMELSLEDSVRVWLADRHSYFPRDPSTTAAYNFVTGMSRLFPYTVRFPGESGGDIRIGSEDLFFGAWNPVAGTQFIYDQPFIQATQDDALLLNPINGLMMPERINSAFVTAQTGLPIHKTMDWVTLSFAATIPVPADAWADWDAVNEQFITVGNKYPGGISALIKSVVSYPSQLFTHTRWHDGSLFSVGDFVMSMILPLDRTKPDSLIYDATATGYPAGIIAVRITSTNPLIIETYSDSFALDAELNVYPWWPKGANGPLPWHTTALASRVEAKELIAFSEDKAFSLGCEWANYLTSPTTTYMADRLGGLPAGYIPYSSTMNSFIPTDEATSRWNNLENWYSKEGHFWVGDGPFFVDEFNWTGKTLTLTNYKDFTDLAGRWDAFSEGYYKAFLFMPVIMR